MVLRWKNQRRDNSNQKKRNGVKLPMHREGARRGHSKQGRKRWASSIAVPEPTAAELASFERIKDALTKHTTLAYFSPKRMLFIDFDVSRDGIEVTVYHVKDEALPKIIKDGPKPAMAMPNNSNGSQQRDSGNCFVSRLPGVFEEGTLFDQDTMLGAPQQQAGK
ncbi:hypothetical protein F5Y05DRAFT_410555 [Hypoxylon sp. FL0543]|nr:hypothetical protein F5Y05DRAFT_410555 [Hypoxylon sp. FL0543]